MAVKTRAVLKTYFQTGDQPTQANFEDLIDSCTNNADGGTISTGSLTFSTASAGIVYSAVGTAASADAASYTVHGKKFKVKNKLQAAIADDETSGLFTVTNTDVNADSVVVGNLSGTVVGGLSESICHTIVTADNTMKFAFTNAGGITVADDTAFTASFAIF